MAGTEDTDDTDAQELIDTILEEATISTLYPHFVKLVSVVQGQYWYIVYVREVGLTDLVVDPGASQLSNGGEDRNDGFNHPTGKPPEMRTRLENRFWSKVDIGSKDECWEWTASAQRYGKFWLAGTTELAHRVAYMLDHDLESLDDIPGDVLKHTCHETLCCNPLHLQPGSQKGNIIESFTDDGGNGEARFVDSEIREIKRLAGSGRTQREIADMFGVSVEMISGILRGDYYSWID